MGNVLATRSSRRLQLSPDITTLSVLTWNVWFDDYHWEKRQRAIFDIAHARLPDIICFQEVLPRFVRALAQESWVREAYVSSDPQSDGSTVQPYGVLMLVKKGLQPTFRFVDLPTYMCRRLLIATLEQERSQPFQVGTVHLESLDNPDLRRRQLQVAAAELATSPNSILCGDFNFCSYRNFHGRGTLENLCLEELMADYLDLWPTLHPATNPHDFSPGYTFDSCINTMIHHHEQMRYDRILARLGPPWRAESIQLLGHHPLDDPASLFPSDHFGLIAHFLNHRQEGQANQGRGSPKLPPHPPSAP